MAQAIGPKLSIVAPHRPKGVPLDSWEAETVLDYDKVYARKYSEDFRDDTATVWKSMYEKNLGRKVSRLPPWEVATNGEKDSEETNIENPVKKDLASIHMDRAQELFGVVPPLSEQPPFQTAEQRRRERKHGGSGKHKHENHHRHHHHHHHHHNRENESKSPPARREEK